MASCAARFDNLAGQTVDYGNVRAGGGSHPLKAFGNASATVQAGGNGVISAASRTNTGLIQANAVYLGGNLVNGITGYFVATSAPRLADAAINLVTQDLPAGACSPWGGILGLGHCVPMLNFFTPIDIGLAYISSVLRN